MNLRRRRREGDGAVENKGGGEWKESECESSKMYEKLEKGYVQGWAGDVSEAKEIQERDF